MESHAAIYRVGGSQMQSQMQPYIESETALYDSFHRQCYHPKIHQIETFKFLSISQYKFKSKF